jgi:hypothetical protein
MARQWRMRRVLASEHSQLWHVVTKLTGGFYRTACGREFGTAGSTWRESVPGSACSVCLKWDARQDEK